MTWGAGAKGRFSILLSAICLASLPLGASIFPTIEISRLTIEAEWPFSVEKGTLTCVPMGPQKFVFFGEPWRDWEKLDRDDAGNVIFPRSVAVTTNPVALLATYEDRSLYLPFDDIETLLKRLEPFYLMGRKLCDEANKLDSSPNEKSDPT